MGMFWQLYCFHQTLLHSFISNSVLLENNNKLEVNDSGFLKADILTIVWRRKKTIADIGRYHSPPQKNKTMLEMNNL